MKSRKMTEQVITLIFEVVPQFTIGIVLYTMCLKESHSQREYHQKTIDSLHRMMTQFIKELSELNER